MATPVSIDRDAVDFVPGTVYLVDIDGTSNAQHAVGAKNDIVLVPAPSSDPDDPLNWSPRRKLLAISCNVVYTFIIGFTSASLYSVFVPISKATGLTLADLNAGTGYMFLFFGWSCLIFQPLALQYGKRPAFLISLLGTLAMQVWAPYTKTNGQWIANKILQGFFGAPVESLVEISITDVFFTHERGGYVALYALALAGSSFFAPIVAGFMATGQGWQWVFYWGAIFCAIGFVYLFLFQEETNFQRHLVVPSTVMVAEKLDDQSTPEPKTLDEVNLSTTPESGSGLQKQSTRSFVSKLKLFRPDAFTHKNELLGMVKRPLVFLSFPVILWSGFNYGSNLVWFNVLNGTAALVLSAPPYSFGANLIGVAYVAPLIGVVIGFLYTGYIGDWLLIKVSRRNNGVMESEHRLYVLVASIICVPLGLLLWGVGAAHSVHWFGLVFAMGVIAFTNTLGLQTSIAYCIDSYRNLSGEAVVTVILVRNTMSFAINYGLTSWVENMGLQNAFIVAAFAGLAQVLTFFIFIKWGKKMRMVSRPRYFKYVKEIEDAGLAHN